MTSNTTYNGTRQQAKWQPKILKILPFLFQGDVKSERVLNFSSNQKLISQEGREIFVILVLLFAVAIWRKEDVFSVVNVTLHIIIHTFFSVCLPSSTLFSLISLVNDWKSSETISARIHQVKKHLKETEKTFSFEISSFSPLLFLFHHLSPYFYS